MVVTEWLRHFELEYLGGLGIAGGSCTKVLVARGATTAEVVQPILARSRELGYTPVSVDAALTRLHLVDWIFRSVAQQLDWDSLAENFARRALSELGIPVYHDRRPVLNSEAAAGSYGSEVVRQLAYQLIESLRSDSSMGRDFRYGAARLVEAAIFGDQYYSTEDVRRWLTETGVTAHTLRMAHVLRPIGRTTAREALRSLGSWVRKSGSHGLVMVLDTTRYSVSGYGSDAGHRYTRIAVFDMFEVMRQFIDGVESAVGMITLFVVPPSFLTDEARGMRAYEALRLRLGDVYQGAVDNPLAPLVRLDSDTGA